MADRNSGNQQDIDERTEAGPDAKRGTGGQAAHGGDQAGPSSHQAGKPQSPQTGDPHADDRQG